MKILSKKIISDKRNYYDISVEDNHNFVLENGIIAHNCGSGCGFSVQTHHIDKLPAIQERKKQPKTFVIEDSIEGWADSLSVLLSSYFVGGGTHPEYEGRRVYFDFQKIRPKGAFISGGFKAPGPEPLRKALDKVEYLIQGLVLKGQTKLLPINAYDIVMHTVDAVLSGGVRRSATICLFSKHDKEMMEAKTGNWFIDNPQRARSNNSVVLIRDQITKEEFSEIMKRTKEFGEPGFGFFDSTEFSTNPCFTGDTIVAVADGRNGITIKQLAEEGVSFPVYSAKENKHFTVRNGWKTEIKNAIAFVTGYKHVITVTLSNGDKFRCTPEHLLALSGGGYIEASNSIGMKLADFFTVNKKYRTINSHTNGYARQHRMIWEYYNGSKPIDFDIDHIDNNGGDFIENLQLLSSENHMTKTSEERLGENNPIHRLKNIDSFRHNRSVASTMENNSRFSGITNDELIQNGCKLIEEGKKITFENLKELDKRTPTSFSKNRFGGSIHKFREICEEGLDYIIEYKNKIVKEDDFLTNDVYVVSISDYNEMEPVYDLTVEDNHNFYILTSGDKNYENSRGILVHNCFEIGMYPYDSTTNESGFQGCNLSEINGSLMTSREKFLESCVAASVLGTLQAGYTYFPYMTQATKNIFERESLLGVSITGWMNNPDLLFNKELLVEGASLVKEINKKLAAMIGINPAARTCCTKPSGTASVLLQTESGIHGAHSKRYIRNAQMNKDAEVAQLIKKTNPYMVEDSVWSTNGTDWVISYPVLSPEGSKYKKDLTGKKLLEYVNFVQNTWVEAGTDVDLCVDPKIRHNVSNTVNVKDNEWDSVTDYIYENRYSFAGISLLSSTGDKDYAQAPFVEVLTEAELLDMYGTGAFFASGLIVDGMKVFSNLWRAFDVARDTSIQSQERLDNQLDWIRRYKKFADNYFEGDLKKAEYCMKDVYNLHKWNKIQQNFVSVDFVDQLKDKKFTEVDTLAGAACHGGACDIL